MDGEILVTARGNLRGRLVLGTLREGTFKTSHAGRVKVSYLGGLVTTGKETVDVEALMDDQSLGTVSCKYVTGSKLCVPLGNLISRTSTIQHISRQHRHSIICHSFYLKNLLAARI